MNKKLKDPKQFTIALTELLNSNKIPIVNLSVTRWPWACRNMATPREKLLIKIAGMVNLRRGMLA